MGLVGRDGRIELVVRLYSQCAHAGSDGEVSIVGRFISGGPNLTTLTSPDKVCLTSTARLLVLLEARDRDPIRVYFAA